MAGFATDCDRALYTKLSAGTALTSLLSGGTADPSIYRGVAPQGVAPPFVVFAVQAPSTPVRSLRGISFENALVTVKAIVDGHNPALAGTIAKRIDELLDGPALTFTDHTHVRCSREQDVDYDEPGPGGTGYAHRGAVYRIQAHL